MLLKKRLKKLKKVVKEINLKNGVFKGIQYNGCQIFPYLIMEQTQTFYLESLLNIGLVCYGFIYEYFMFIMILIRLIEKMIYFKWKRIYMSLPLVIPSPVI